MNCDCSLTASGGDRRLTSEACREMAIANASLGEIVAMLEGEQSRRQPDLASLRGRIADLEAEMVSGRRQLSFVREEMLAGSSALARYQERLADAESARSSAQSRLGDVEQRLREAELELGEKAALVEAITSRAGYGLLEFVSSRTMRFPGVQRMIGRVLRHFTPSK